ncbi:hypothetical protein DRP05_12830 [Archaeoglobales archaeon]|nr:MAG: hypothetical protein DRP05_12830 [Archaeoglobales archaeon]
MNLEEAIKGKEERGIGPFSKDPYGSTDPLASQRKKETLSTSNIAISQAVLSLRGCFITVALRFTKETCLGINRIAAADNRVFMALVLCTFA